MQFLELLAPARNADIGIAAIDCGADAVYIAGPDFGARKAAGNGFDEIRRLCDYAHQFGAKVFVTYNTIIFDDELDKAHAQMLLAQEAGADAFIIRDERITGWEDITVPLHASTQCAIRDPERAKYYESIGCGRLTLERELTLDDVRKISAAVDAEIEFFVHGALCVCYSGECRLSEAIDGRSADRGECIQACRSLYDLEDASGRTILRNKAVLSLKDYNLKARLQDLAEAGVSSFKIEGRLKNASYVKNVVRDYDLALNALIAKYPDKYRRASFGRVSGGFTPDTDKTFNRGYTELWLDGRRGPWSSMDAPKSMGEYVGRVVSVRKGEREMEVLVEPASARVELHNGDGFAFSTRDGVTGFRGDVCSGRSIVCKPVPDLREGVKLFRNINSAFEKVLDTQACRREMHVGLEVSIHGKYAIDVLARTEDGREVLSTFNTDVETAENRERAEAMLREQLSKRSGIYWFKLDSLEVHTAGGNLPLLSASTINGIRRLVASDVDSYPVKAVPLTAGNRPGGEVPPAPVQAREDELMRSRYCVRYELGLCPRHQGAPQGGPLFLVNNGRRLALGFDCARCEMTVKEA
jgi:putative protease